MLIPTRRWPVWQDWAIYWTLGNFLQPLATLNLPNSLTFLGNFYKGVKLYHISSEIILGQLLLTFGDFFLVTLTMTAMEYAVDLFFCWEEVFYLFRNATVSLHTAASNAAIFNGHSPHTLEKVFEI